MSNASKRPDIDVLDGAVHQLLKARDRHRSASLHIEDALDEGGLGPYLARHALYGAPTAWLAGHDAEKPYLPQPPHAFRTVARLASATIQALHLATPRRRSPKKLLDMASRETSPYIRLHLLIWYNAKIAAQEHDKRTVDSILNGSQRFMDAWNDLSRYDEPLTSITT